MVEASGPLAGGLETEQTSQGPNGSDLRLTGVRCDEPATDFWFVSPGQDKASDLTLYVMNVDAQAAVADVEVFSDAGPLTAGLDTSIAIPAYSRIVQSLAGLTRGSRVLALHVRTSVGRLVAGIRASLGAGQGADWLPAAQPPATRVVVPGLPQMPGARQLYIADPGSSDAQVKVKAVTPQGTFAPKGAPAEGVDVPAGSAVSLDLPDMGGTSGAIQLTASAPVTAGLMVTSALSNGSDVAFTAATSPLAQQGVVTDDRSGSGYTSTVVVSAPSAAAQVRIGTIGPVGGAPAADRTISIPAGHSQAVQVPAPAGAGSAFTIVVTPLAGSGPVYAGRVLARKEGGGSAVTILPIVSAPTSVSVPSARGSLTAVVP
jgi:hypothetical protein